MRALSTFEGVALAWTPGFSFDFDCPPLPTGPDDRQRRPSPQRLSSTKRAPGRAQLGSRPLGIPRRLGRQPGAHRTKATFRYRSAPRKPNRLLRRPGHSPSRFSRSVLPASAAWPSQAPSLASRRRPALTAVPLFLALPVGLTCWKLQANCKRDGRMR